MKVRLTASQIRLNLLVCLPLSRTPKLALPATEIAALAIRAGWVTRDERLSVKSRTDSRIENALHNVVSHRSSVANPIRLGLVSWNPSTGNLSLKAKGAAFLERVAAMLGASASTRNETLSDWLRKEAR